MFLSYAYPNPGPSNLVKNEIFILDITSGMFSVTLGLFLKMSTHKILKKKKKQLEELCVCANFADLILL